MSNTQMANMADLAKGLKQSAQNVDSGGGNFMKFAKGEWTWGAEETEVEEDALWAVHPNGFQHGWIAWGDKEHNNDGTKLGETMCTATEPLPFEKDLPEIEGEWVQQIAMQLVCLSGIDKGVKLTFNSCSTGGRKAYADVINAVVTEITAGNDGVCPAVTLGVDSYKHKTFGKTFVPIITIKSWKTLADLNAILDAADSDDEPEEEVKKVEKKTAKKSTSKAGKNTDDVEEIEEDDAARKARMKAEMKAELKAEAKAEALAEAKAEAAAELAAEAAEEKGEKTDDKPVERKRKSRRQKLVDAKSKAPRTGAFIFTQLRRLP